MLDEKALRRPEWVEGHEFRLADGQLWHFAEPSLETFPRFTDGECHLGLATDFGPEFDAIVQKIDDAKEFSDEIAIAFKLARFMIQKNYFVSDADLARLFRFRIGDEDSRNLYAAVVGVATGTVPKHSADGSN